MLLLGKELGDALAREESDPWPAPQKDIASGRGTDALDGLSGENLNGGDEVVARGGMNVEVGVLTGEEEVEGAGVGGLGEVWVEG